MDCIAHMHLVKLTTDRLSLITGCSPSQSRMSSPHRTVSASTASTASLPRVLQRLGGVRLVGIDDKSTRYLEIPPPWEHPGWAAAKQILGRCGSRCTKAQDGTWWWSIEDRQVVTIGKALVADPTAKTGAKDLVDVMRRHHTGFHLHTPLGRTPAVRAHFRERIERLVSHDITVKDYQMGGIAWLNLFRGGVLADDMGLGKTPQALIAVALQGSRTLVLAPSNVQHKWVRDAEKFLGSSYKAVVFKPTMRTKGLPPDTTMLVATVDSVRSPENRAVFEQFRFANLIADEVNAYKNPESSRTKAFIEIVQDQPAEGLRIGLTGTPMGNDATELWPLLQIFRPELVGITRTSSGSAVQNAHRQYEQGHCIVGTQRVLVPLDRIKRRFKNDVIVEHNGKHHVERTSPVMGTRDPDVLHHLLHAGMAGNDGFLIAPPLMLRRMKDEVSDLPPRSTSRQIIPSDDASTKALTAFAQLPASAFTTERPVSEDSADDGPDDTPAGVAYAEARQAAGLSKVVPAIDRAEQEIKGKGCVVVAAHHHTVIAALSAAAEARGITTCVIDGTISALQKSKRQQAFQGGEYQMAIISLAAKDGIDLTRASTMIMAERQPVPIWESQTEARIHRVGQTAPCTIVYLHLESSIDDVIDAAVEDKRADIAHAIDGKRLPIRQTTPGSLRDLHERARQMTGMRAV
jgi:SNF2 family DNA or RNA helicase